MVAARIIVNPDRFFFLWHEKKIVIFWFVCSKKKKSIFQRIVKKLVIILPKDLTLPMSMYYILHIMHQLPISNIYIVYTDC